MSRRRSGAPRRAINPGKTGVLTVTHGPVEPQVGPVQTKAYRFPS
jgi:hypothetical protein